MELTLRPSRLRYLLFITFFAGFVAGGALMVRAGNPKGWAAILLFGVLMVVCCMLLLPGSTYLKLDPTGFTICSLFRVHSIRWYEVDSFEAANGPKINFVVINFSTFGQGQQFARKLAVALGRHDVLLPDTYGLSAEDLAAVMNDWRERWAASTAS